MNLAYLMGFGRFLQPCPTSIQCGGNTVGKAFEGLRQAVQGYCRLAGSQQGSPPQQADVEPARADVDQQRDLIRLGFRAVNKRICQCASFHVNDERSLTRQRDSVAQPFDLLGHRADPDDFPRSADGCIHRFIVEHGRINRVGKDLLRRLTGERQQIPVVVAPDAATATFFWRMPAARSIKAT